MERKLEFGNRPWTRSGNFLAALAGVLLLNVTVDIVASAQSYRVLTNFTGSDGAGSWGSLLLEGSTLYGTTAGGGNLNYPSGNGVVFKLNTDGSGYTVLRNFGGYPSDGANPQAGLVLSGSTLYGTTAGGGSTEYSAGSGVVFKVNTDGSGYTVLRAFGGYPSDGANPKASLVLSGSTLYGTTANGGNSGSGVVFKLNTDGSGYTVLKNFGGGDGAVPCGGLLLAGGTLYGTTAGGGARGCGEVFKMNTDGSGFTVLKSFTGWDGASPLAGLVLSGSTLYGTTCNGPGEGPYQGNGTVFKLNTDGSGFAMLKSFTGTDGDGANPQAGLVLTGSTLYGTTLYGGYSGGGWGVVFKMNTDGSGYAALKRFNGAYGDGKYPLATPFLRGSTLYGTTQSGGANDYGVVFSLTCLSITAAPLSQTAEAGTTVGFQVEATSATGGLAYQWFFNGTNLLGGATDAFLGLTNVQPAQAGAYTVVVTNLAEGAVTSAPALLSVIPLVDRRVVPAVHLTGGADSFLHLEYADSLAVPYWSSLSNLTLSGGQQLCFDLSQALPTARFYRAWQTNGPNPVLQASMATEIPLAGAIGSSVRVDYINAIGPTDAWVTLDTVLLTNTTQLYFDLTAFRQPTRLYRLVPLP